MKRSLALICVLLSFVACNNIDQNHGNGTSEQSSPKYDLDSTDIAYLTRVVDSMYDLDQGVRNRESNMSYSYGLKKQHYLYSDADLRELLQNKYAAFVQEKDSLRIQMKSIDESNTDMLLELTRRYGFPSEKRLNQYKAKAYWIFVHSRWERADEIRPILDKETEAGRMSPFQREYVEWHFNGRTTMPPYRGDDGQPVYREN